VCCHEDWLDSVHFISARSSGRDRSGRKAFFTEGRDALNYIYTVYNCVVSASVCASKFLLQNRSTNVDEIS
jgi:hypothetical protein